MKNAVAVALKYSVDSEIVLGINDGGKTSESDEDWLFEAAAADSRLKISRPKRLLSMTENFRFTFSQLSGEWQTIIGADDGVLPTLEPLLSFADAHSSNPQIALFPRAYYFWPGVEDTFGAAHVDLTSSPRYRIRKNLARNLPEVLSATQSYLILPQLYSGGAIRRTLVQEIGIERLFSSYSPDVSASVALALTGEHAIEFEIPALWVGTSPASNGLAVSTLARQTGIPEIAPEATQFAFRARSDEFFRLSQSDGHGLDSAFDDLPHAKFVVAASAYTSARLLNTLSTSILNRFCTYARFAVVSSMPTPGSRQVRVLDAVRGISQIALRLLALLGLVSHLFWKQSKAGIFSILRVAKKRSARLLLNASSVKHVLTPSSTVRLKLQQESLQSMTQATDSALSLGILLHVSFLNTDGYRSDAATHRPQNI